MAVINTNVFSSDIRALPNFNDLVNYFQGSQTLVDLINRMPEEGIQLTPIIQSGTSTTIEDGQPVIRLDPSWFPGSGSPNSEAIGTFATTLAHELGHAVDGGNANSNAESSPENAITTGLRDDGIALMDEYRVAVQLDVFMHSGQDIQSTLDQLVPTYPDIGSTEFANAAITSAADWTASQSPSPAPNLTYSEYYKDQWILAKANADQSAIDWTLVQRGQIQATTNPDGSITISGSDIQLLTPTIKENISGVVSGTGVPVSREISTVQTFDDGSTLNISKAYDTSGQVTEEKVNARQPATDPSQSPSAALQELEQVLASAQQQLDAALSSGNLSQLAQVEVVTDFGPNGLVESVVVDATDTDGRQSLASDLNGDGASDQLEVSYTDENGSRVDDVRSLGADGSVDNETITTVSQDGTYGVATDDQHGNVETDYFDTNGNKTADFWSNSAGDQGDDNFGSDGSSFPGK